MASSVAQELEPAMSFIEMPNGKVPLIKSQPIEILWAIIIGVKASLLL